MRLSLSNEEVASIETATRREAEVRNACAEKAREIRATHNPRVGQEGACELADGTAATWKCIQHYGAIPWNKQFSETYDPPLTRAAVTVIAEGHSGTEFSNQWDWTTALTDRIRGEEITREREYYSFRTVDEFLARLIEAGLTAAEAAAIATVESVRQRKGGYWLRLGDGRRATDYVRSLGKMNIWVEIDRIVAGAFRAGLVHSVKP